MKKSWERNRRKQDLTGGGVQDAVHSASGLHAVKLVWGKLASMFRLNQKKGSYYKKSLIMVLIAALVPIATVGLISYTSGTRQIKAEVSRTHSIQLKQAYDDINRQLVHLESIASEWAFNPIFSSELNRMDLGIRFDIFYDLVGALRVMNGSSPLVYDTRIYVNNSMTGDLTVSNSQGLRHIKGEEESRYKELFNKTNSYFWEDSSKILKDDSIFPKVLIYKVPGNIGNPYGTLMFFLDKKAVNKIISQLNIDQEGASFILGEDNSWLASGNVIERDKSGLYDILRNEIIKNKSKSGSFTYKYNDESYLVTAETLSQNGWKFVVATPLSRLMSPVMFMSRLIIFSCAVVLLIALFLSFIASRNIYSPIKTLLGLVGQEAEENSGAGRDEIKYIQERWTNISLERKQLKSELESSRDSLKYGFLLQLVQGHLYFLPENELKEQFRQYWWEPENKTFSVLFIRISGYCTDDAKFQKGDEQLVTYAGFNIAAEAVKESGLEAAVLNLHDLSVAVLLSFNENNKKEEIKSKLFHLSYKLMEVLTSFLKVKVTIAVGRQKNSLKSIGEVLQEARQALHYRDINKNEEVIDMESLIPYGDNKAGYPFTLEKNFLECLRMGMEVEAITELEKFVQRLRDVCGKEILFKQGVLQLLGSMMHMLNKSGVSPDTLCPGIDLYDELGKINEPSEIISWFKERVVMPYIHQILNAREQLTEQSVKKVIEIIANQYNMPISLENCADKAGMTPYTLSREFKLYTGVNFIDYLTDLRLKNAKSLLKDTSLTINEIAEKVGYQTTYFVRIFKKLEGMTPGQFRERSTH